MNARIQELQALTWRWWLHLKRQPYTLSFGLFQPMIWFVLFGQLFKNAIKVPGVPEGQYLTFMTAGVIVLTTTMNGLMGGIDLLFDKETRVLHRMLVAPIGRSSLLWSRFFYVWALSLVQSALVLGMAVFFGVTMKTGVLGLLILLAMVGGLAAGLTTLSLGLAFILRHHADFFSIMGIINLPIMFLSSALMPVEGMPGWMAAVARVNPMTFAIDSARSLMMRGWEPSLLLGSTAGLLVFNVLVFAWAIRIFRRPLE